MFGVIQDLIGGVGALSNQYNPFDEDYQQREDLARIEEEQRIADQNAMYEQQARSAINSPVAQSSQMDQNYAANTLAGNKFVDKFGNELDSQQLQDGTAAQKGQWAAQKVEQLTATPDQVSRRYQLPDDPNTDDGKMNIMKKVLYNMGAAAIIGASGGIALPALLMAGMSTSRKLHNQYDRSQRIDTLEKEGYTFSSIQDYVNSGDRSSLIKDTLQQINDGNFTRQVGQSTGLQYGQAIANETTLVDPKTQRQYIQRGNTLLDAKTLMPAVDVDPSSLMTTAGYKDRVSAEDASFDRMEKNRRFGLDAAGTYSTGEMNGFMVKFNNRTGKHEVLKDKDGNPIPAGGGVFGAGGPASAWVSQYSGSTGEQTFDRNKTTGVIRDMMGNMYDPSKGAVFDARAQQWVEATPEYTDYFTGERMYSTPAAAIKGYTNTTNALESKIGLEGGSRKIENLMNASDADLDALGSTRHILPESNIPGVSTAASAINKFYEEQTLTPAQKSLQGDMSILNADQTVQAIAAAKGAGASGINTLPEVQLYRQAVESVDLTASPEQKRVQFERLQNVYDKMIRAVDRQIEANSGTKSGSFPTSRKSEQSSAPSVNKAPQQFWGKTVKINGRTVKVNADGTYQ